MPALRRGAALRVRRLPLAALAAILLAVGLTGAFRMPLNGDAAYVLDVARRMLDGSVLYRDIIDLNPPFIFWASMPAAAIGGGGPSAIAALKLFVVIVVAGTFAAGWGITRWAPATRAGFGLMALVLVGGYFGEREHLLFALTFPYVALAARRGEEGAPSPRSALLAGALAAAGFALKPTAMLVPVLLVVRQCRRARSWRLVLNAEHVALALGLAAALLSLLVFAPGYPGVVQRIGAAYGEFNRERLGALLARDVHMWVVWLALALAILFGRSVPAAGRITVYALAVLGLFGSAVLQGKGFGYHYFPAVGWAVIVLVELLAGANTIAGARAGAHPGPVAIARRVLAALVLLPVLYLFGGVAWRRAHGVFTRMRQEQATVARLAGPAPVEIAILSVRIADAYPMVVERRHDVVLSYPQLWAAALPPDRAGTAQVRRRYGEDLLRRPPAALIVRAPAPADRGIGDIDVDYLAYLCRDEVARRALARYRLAERAGGFDLYRPDAPGRAACASS